MSLVEIGLGGNLTLLFVKGYFYKSKNIFHGGVMKKILFILSAVGLTSCNTYTVKNSTDVEVKVNGDTVAARFCVEYVDFFGVIGDFPLTIADSSGKSVGGEGKEYPPANYSILGSDLLKVEEIENPCKLGRTPKPTPTLPIEVSPSPLKEGDTTTTITPAVKGPGPRTGGPPGT